MHDPHNRKQPAELTFVHSLQLRPGRFTALLHRLALQAHVIPAGFDAALFGIHAPRVRLGAIGNDRGCRRDNCAPVAGLRYLRGGRSGFGMGFDGRGLSTRSQWAGPLPQVRHSVVRLYREAVRAAVGWGVEGRVRPRCRRSGCRSRDRTGDLRVRLSGTASPPAVAAGGVMEALNAAREWINAADHDEHCFTNDPNPDACRCVCDKDSVIALIDDVTAALAVGDEGIREGAE